MEGSRGSAAEPAGSPGAPAEARPVGADGQAGLRNPPGSAAAAPEGGGAAEALQAILARLGIENFADRLEHEACLLYTSPSPRD
eukprot:9386542-Alexandrium_andersonii.AAC.1